MDTLPPECIYIIATQSCQVWFSLVRVFKHLSLVDNSHLFGKFAKIRVEPNAIKCVLPNSELHSVDDNFAYFLASDCHSCCLLELGIPDNMYSAAEYPLGRGLSSVFGFGKKVWYKRNKIHRDGDLPAVIYGDGSAEWYRDDLLHRDDDQPAYVSSCGTKVWYCDGEIHRDGDLPAIEHSNGIKIWYRRGKRHRDGDLPAKISPVGTMMWYCEDVIYRDFGPAAIYPDGRRVWFVNGEPFLCTKK